MFAKETQTQNFCGSVLPTIFNPLTRKNIKTMEKESLTEFGTANAAMLHKPSFTYAKKVAGSERSIAKC